MQGYAGIQLLYKTDLQYCVLQLEAALKIMQMYLLISTKLNISVISIRISEDHYGSNLGTEIGALLAREKFTRSIKYSRLLLLIVVVTWPYAPLTIVPLTPFLSVNWRRYTWHHISKLKSCISQITLWGIAIKLLKYSHWD